MRELSLIIATYNRASWVVQTLESVVAQSAAPELWECVVVNNNSTDETVRVVERFIEAHPEFDIRLVTETKQGLSHARNCGIESSCAEVIAIIDDDEVINEEFIEAYIDLFARHPEVASAGGKIIPRYRSSRPQWMSKYTERPIANPIDLGESEQPFPKGMIPGGGNMAIRRSALARYGAFDPNLGRRGELLIGGEENDLFQRLAQGGEVCWYCPRAVMFHIIPDEKLTREYLDRLSYNIGVSQRIRAKIEGRGYVVPEAVKWCATVAIACSYILCGDLPKARYLWRMRRMITKGLLSKS